MATHDTLSLSRLAREPYRVLFPLGVLFGVTGVGHWLSYAAGWSPHYSGFLHAGVQMQAYITAFIAGFLMTFVPRVTSTRPASPLESSLVVGLLVAVWALLMNGLWVLAQAAFVSVLAVLLAFLLSRVAGRRGAGKGVAAPKPRPPVELVWVPFALLLGLLGAVLLAGGQAGWLPVRALSVGRPMLQEGFVLAVVVGVGGFLAPRVMGTYRLPKPAPDGAGASGGARRSLALHGAGGLLLLASFVLEGVGQRPAAYLLRAVLVTAFFVRSRTLAWRPVVRDPFVRYLWISVWMVFLGVWGAALAPAYRVAALHLVFLGGYSLMTFAVGTMVVLSHAGRAKSLRSPSWTLRVTGGGVLAALALRLAAAALPEHYFALLGAAATVWLVAAVTWLTSMAPRLLEAIPVVEISREHEQSKLRVVGQRPTF
jgi:uncharacterized protein involved in response to NO